MNAEVIAIGTELLLGFVVNSDTAYLGRMLAGLGICCYRQVTVGDNPARLAEAIETALDRADLVITCGGLGPTVDDVTLETIARATGRKLILRTSLLRTIEGRFKRRGIRMPPSNRRQAMLPEGAVLLPNAIGTAPGFLLELSSSRKRGSNRIPALDQVEGRLFAGMTKILVALPGPPAELKPMAERHLLPRLRKMTRGSVLLSRTLKLTGAGEPAVDAKVRDLLALQGAVTLGIYAHPGQVDLRITARGKSAAEAQRLIGPVEKKLRARAGNLVYGADEETLEGVVGLLLKKRRKTLAVAESCTGGGVAERLTRVPGSSSYFLGGVVSYADEMKSAALSVPAALFRRHGAVSAQAAGAMAKGIRRLTGSDYGLSITGIAGPSGGTKAKPVGLVFMALSFAGETRTARFLFTGDRAAIRLKATQAALNLLRLRLRG